MHMIVCIIMYYFILIIAKVSIDMPCYNHQNIDISRKNVLAITIKCVHCIHSNEHTHFLALWGRWGPFQSNKNKIHLMISPCNAVGFYSYSTGTFIPPPDIALCPPLNRMRTYNTYTHERENNLYTKIFLWMNGFVKWLS